jgi:hypothetical protein
MFKVKCRNKTTQESWFAYNGQAFTEDAAKALVESMARVHPEVACEVVPANSNN